MARAACLLALLSLAILVLIVVRLDGATATIFSFLGIPALVAAMGLYVLHRWRIRRLPQQEPAPDQLTRKESSMRYAIPLMASLFFSAGIGLAADGAALFKQNCASCHGATGQADTPASKALKVPALAGDAKVAGMSDADVAAAIKANPKHGAVLKKLSDADVAAVATYVKGLAAGK